MSGTGERTQMSNFSCVPETEPVSGVSRIGANCLIYTADHCSYIPVAQPVSGVKKMGVGGGLVES